MELKVQEIKTPEAILFNYEELKQAIEEKTKPYEMTVYTADQIPLAKSDRAMLNKLKKTLNDDRIRREREYMQPFTDYKCKINEIIGIIDKGVKNIDGQIKSAEENRKEEKMQEILNLWNGNNNIPEWLHIKQIFNDKWLNASVKISTIEKELTAKLEAIEKDLTVLRELPEFSFEAIEEYKQSLDAVKAIATAKRAEEIAKKKADAELLAQKKAEFAKMVHADEELLAKKKAELAKAVIQNNETMAESLEQSAKSAHTAADAFNTFSETVETPKSWVSFRALLSTEDALALKQFFNDRNIKFEKI